ncbi:Exocyst complex component 4 [Blomia tropicalis]|nr:Exocyst complex component 4 [Blomia tropicalis]
MADVQVPFVSVQRLDHLLSSIFINSVLAVHRIKPNGIQRSCRAIYDIQRRLAAITRTRELALVYARQYFELLLTTPEEILASIIERGPQFQFMTEQSTVVWPLETLVQLVVVVVASSGINGNYPLTLNMDQYLSNVDMERNLQRLNDVLNVGTTPYIIDTTL